MRLVRFYYDESFHDRKITLKGKEVNIYKVDASDSFVAVFVGGDNAVIDGLNNKFSRFETKHKKSFGLEYEQELKATVIGKRNFKHGVSSFNKDTLTFYKDYFSIYTESVYIQVNVISKTAQVIWTIFQNVKLPYVVKKKEFLYSVTKFLNNYRFNDILIRIFEERGKLNSKILMNEFIKNLKLIFESSSDSTKKRLERAALNDLITILNGVKDELNISYSYEWDYNNIFNLFDTYIIEHSIIPKQIDLFIDNEVNTLEMATKDQKFKSVTSCKSEENEGIRTCDILSNFIGRMVKALSDELQEPVIGHVTDVETYDFKTKRILSKDWFNLNEEQFNLYKVINNILKSEKTSVYHSFYFDHTILFIGILSYVSEYSTYSDYQKNSLEIHAEYFNTYCCMLIKDQYSLL
ncbi:hypothetical protein AB4Z50_34925 [Paenibacillus sp. 2TAB26]|uniref:hypothetical protein n=1 Tax=Paenibacillus sp. 2TAB26 TaxID=3233005 RepID=UPI003F94E7B4